MAVSEWYVRKDDKAEHLVYLDSKTKELDKLISGEKTMIIRGAAAKKSPLGGRAKTNDIVYFVQKGGNMLVTHRGVLGEVVERYKMTPTESNDFIKHYEQQLQLSKEQEERWNGKKCVGVFEVLHIEEIEPFAYNREKNMDDWIITDNIDKIKL